MPRSAYNGTSGALRALAYVRVSTQEQSSSGAGLEAQRQAITAEADRRGWNLVAMFEDAGLSGKNLNRPGLEQALAAVKSGQANAIVVAKLDRLSRSLVDFASLLADAKHHGYNIVALDLGVDLSTPAGEFLASVMASAAQWERRIISQRTRDALAVKRAQGVRLGRPREMSTDAIRRIHELRESGLTVAAIARQLDAEQMPTPRGGKWESHGVNRALRWVD
jgi:DNA invertase Pin-like site-specific DNA recombinase